MQKYMLNKNKEKLKKSVIMQNITQKSQKQDKKSVNKYVLLKNS